MARPKIGDTHMTYFWEEKPGIQSTIRIQMFITLFFAFWMTYLKAMGKTDLTDGTLLLLYLGAFTPKVLSKFGEVKGLIKKDTK